MLVKVKPEIDLLGFAYMKFAQKLKSRRKELGLTQQDIADIWGIKSVNVSDWERGKGMPEASRLPSLARRLGLSISELMGETGVPPAIDSNVEVLKSTASVPLISWVQAGAWCEAFDPYNVGDAEEWIPCPVKHGPKTYALKVRGDSMLDPNGKPSFSEGDVIFCDPSREAQHRSLVIARQEQSKEATFKRLLIDGDRRFLEALNPSWPNRVFEINEETSVCGIVIAKLEYLS